MISGIFDAQARLQPLWRRAKLRCAMEAKTRPTSSTLKNTPWREPPPQIGILLGEPLFRRSISDLERCGKSALQPDIVDLCKVLPQGRLGSIARQKNRLA